MRVNFILKPVAVIFALAWVVSCQQGTNQSTTEVSNTAQVETLSDGGQSTVSDNVSQPDIVKIAAGSKDHTTLVQAVQAAGLVDVLASSGPYTVFAPVNTAFEQLPPGTVEQLLKPEKKGDLRNILQFHVTTSVFKIENFKDGQKLPMVDNNNSKATVHVKDGKVMIEEATILGSVQASNGIIHVIDKVLLPPAKQ